MSKNLATASSLLKAKFLAKHVDAAVRHFQGLVGDFQNGKWETCITGAGRFAEAVTKLVWVHAGETVPPGKEFKVGKILDQVPQKGTLPESLRITIPRGLRFVYEIASNRGARHDADEIEANHMDASAVVPMCAWMLSELVRVSQKGLDLDHAKRVVDSLIKRRFPLFEEIDGRVYVDAAKSAREVGLLILRQVFPRRIADDDLVDQISRHGFKRSNATVAVRRLTGSVDRDTTGLRLRNTGMKEAEKLIEAAAEV